MPFTTDGGPPFDYDKTVAVDWHIPTTFSPTSWRDVKFVNVLTIFFIFYLINVARKKFLRSIDMRQATQPSQHFYFQIISPPPRLYSRITDWTGRGSSTYNQVAFI